MPDLWRSVCLSVSRFSKLEMYAFWGIWNMHFFQLIVEWLVSVFWLYCYVHSLKKWKHSSHLCQTPVSMSHTRSVHVQIQSKWPSWNVAQQVTHTIYCFQGLVNQISLQSSPMNSIGFLCYISYFVLWWHNRSFWILS